MSTEEDLERINTAFQNECREIFGISHTLSDFELRRIDYCINFEVKDSGLDPDKIIQLIKRADKPAQFDIWEKYSKKSGRKKPGEFSYYLINNSLHINCYYKYKQLENEFSDYSEIEKSRHIIRFEIQMLPQKVYQMKKSIEEPENINEALMSDDYCMEMLLKYYKKTIGFGNYTTLYNAVKIVEGSNFKQNRKQKIIETLKLINEKRSIYKARESLKTKKEIDNFNKSLKKLQELKLNGVTIPEGWRVQLFKNLIYSLFKPIQGNTNS